MTASEGSSLADFSDSLASAVESAGKHVVSVAARRRGAASGLHWRPGIVVTADHVVERDEGITIQTQSGDKLAAAVVGRDPTTDIAVLSFEPGSLDGPPRPPGKVPHPGQLVVAVARPGDAGLSVSFGAISSVGPEWRTWAGGRIDHLIRPDLTFYPGFSGGPLVDVTGQVLGLNTSGLSRGMGLTIPAVTVERVVDQLAQGGRISRGYLGVRMQSVELPEAIKTRMSLEGGSALLVVAVEPDGPAEAAGILVGDILVAIDSKLVTESDAVQAILDPETVGKAVNLKIVRGGEERQVAATIAERPEKERGNGSGHGHGRGQGRGRGHGHG
jgi:serine protease DegQ